MCFSLDRHSVRPSGHHKPVHTIQLRLTRMFLTGLTIIDEMSAIYRGALICCCAEFANVLSGFNVNMM